MTKQELQIAELQSLCARTLEILREEKFFNKTMKGEAWHSSLYRDLKKASNGKEFKMFIELIKALEAKNEI